MLEWLLITKIVLTLSTEIYPGSAPNYDLKISEKYCKKTYFKNKNKKVNICNRQ